jgi:hypothetical protein
MNYKEEIIKMLQKADDRCLKIIFHFIKELLRLD